jgi:CheY-like chemotaxis protein
MALKMILIVEDEEVLRESMESLLKEEGYQVRSAVDGEDAYRILESIDKPCLFLVDLLMPNMDGWEFLERVREHGADNGLAHRSLVISGSANAQNIAQQEEAGYIGKPFHIDELLEIVAKVFAAAKA